MSDLFEQVIGQERAINFLRSHLKNDNIAHAYLIVGEKGTGKEFLGRLFAKYILCGNKKEDNCQSCQKFQHNSHPDFIFIDGSKGIKINDIRKLIDDSSLSPSISSKKVILVSGFENGNQESYNAFLKTLEEPSQTCVIILLSSSLEQIPETLISRSQLIRVNKFSKSKLKNKLSKLYPQEKVDEVIKIADYDIGLCYQMLEDEDILQQFRELLKDAKDIIESKDVIKVLELIDRYNQEKKLLELLQMMTKVITHSLSDADPESPYKISSDVSLGKIIIFAQNILKIYRNLSYNISLKLAMEKIALEGFYYEHEKNSWS